MTKSSLLKSILTSLLVSSSYGAIFQGRAGSNDTINLPANSDDTYAFDASTIDEVTNVDTILNYDTGDIIRVYATPPKITSAKCFQDGRIKLKGQQIALVKPRPMKVTFGATDPNDLTLKTETVLCEAVPTPCDLKRRVEYGLNAEIKCGVNETHPQCNVLNIFGKDVKKVECNGLRSCEDSCIDVNSTLGSLELNFGTKAFNGGQLKASGVKKVMCMEEGCKSSIMDIKCDQSSGCEYMCSGGLSCPYGVTTLDNPKSIVCKGTQSCHKRVFNIGSFMSDLLFEGDFAAEFVKINGMSGAKKIVCKSLSTCNKLEVDMDLDEDIKLEIECGSTSSCSNALVKFNKKLGFAGTVAVTATLKCSMPSSCTKVNLKSTDVDLTVNCDKNCGEVFVNDERYTVLKAFQGGQLMEKECKIWNVSTISVIGISGGINIILIIVLIGIIKKNFDVNKLIREKDAAAIIGTQKSDNIATATEQI